VAAIAAEASLESIKSRANFPDWLGYLGVVLFFCGEAESQDHRLSHAWIPQLCAMLRNDSPLRQSLLAKSEGNGLLTLADLEAMERALATG
jgi:hypothetical protein